MPIKAALIDIGNVLLFFSYAKMYNQMATLTGLSGSEAQGLLSYSDLAIRYELGQISSSQLFQQVCAASKLQLQEEAFFLAISDIFTPNPPIYPVIEKLKESGIRLLLLSNTCEAHFEFIAANYPVIHLFDEWILSYKIGARKPQKEIFQAALTKAGTAPSECLYIDDIHEYILQARSLGIDAEQYTDTDTLLQQLQKRGL